MNRAERRRLEQQAKKDKVDVSSYFRNPMVEETLERERIANKAVEVYRKAGLEAVWEQAYQDSMRMYDEQFSTAIVISCAMMLKDNFPNWGNKAIERRVQEFMNYLDKYGNEYKYDIGKFKDLYAITFGEPLIMTHEEEITPPVRKVKT